MKSKILMLSFLLAMAVGTALGQTINVKGVVVDEFNEPILGASVRLKRDASKGANSDINGAFTLQAKQGELLVVSYVGYKTQEVKAASQLRIKMMPDAELLDEVIVVAFGTAKKSAFTGSAVQVGSEDLEKRQVSNVTQALAGKVPGIRVSSGNNQPGMTASISIRGVGSFSAGGGPLYVVDGVPYDGDISAINPQDIASTSILKDAASAALYGARGANGVIMITTKSGSKGKDRLNVTFEARYGVNSRAVGDYDVIKDPKMYAAKHFEALYNNQMSKKGATSASAYEAAVADYFNPDTKAGTSLIYHPFTYADKANPFILQPNGSFVMDPATTIGGMYNAPDGKKYWLTPDDWSKEIFQSKPRQEYNLSISGASDKATYYMSAGYLNDQGYTVGSSFDRFTARIRTDFTPFKWWKLGANLGMTNYTSKYLGLTSESRSSGNIFALTNFIAPIFPMYVRGEDKQIVIDKWGNQVYDFGNLTYPGLQRPYLAIANPYAVNKLDVSNNKADIISARGYMDFNLMEGLKATINVGYDSDNTYSTTINNVYYGQFANYGGIASKDFSRQRSINAQQLLTYLTSFGRHNLDLLAGHEFYYRKSEYFSGSKENMYSPDNTEINGAISKPSVSSSRSEYATEGFLGRIQYDYDSKYFASASYRRDASSRFAKQHRWGNFWSVGASWLLSREAFMSGAQSWLDMLKLKVSYGVQGNDAIGSFRYMDLYSLSNSNDQLATAFSTKGNPNLTWETSHNLNTGIEFSLFEERLSGGLDFYIREVTDMLFWRTTPRSAGYGGYYDNIGSMKNTGIDFSLNGVVLKTKDLRWDLFVNGGWFVNRLTKLPAEWEAVEGGYRSGSSVYRIGGSIYDRAYAKFLGVNENGVSEWQTYDKKKNEYGKTTDPNVAQEKENRVIYENVAPVLTGGLGTNLQWKGLDFSVTMTYALGGMMYDATYQSLMHGGAGGSVGTNWHKDILNSWTPENKGSNIPMVNFGGKYFNSSSDRFLISRDYLAIDNITLGYTMPKAWLDPLNVSSLRVYVVADNLALFSARKGLDPRFGSGVGFKAIRSISGGLRLTF